VLKVVCWAGLMYGLWVGLEALLPPALPFMHVVPKSRFGHDLVYTLVLLGYNLVCQGLLYLIAWISAIAAAPVCGGCACPLSPDPGATR